LNDQKFCEVMKTMPVSTQKHWCEVTVQGNLARFQKSHHTIRHFTFMSQSLHRKLLREFKAIKQEARKDYSVQLDGQDLTHWTISLFGAAATDWEGAVFRLNVIFPAQYPIECPEVRFVGVIPFHPNVYSNGKICLDLLQHNWSAAYGIDAVIVALQALLQSPNPASPANSSAAELLMNNVGEYRRRVRKCVESTWIS
jgi:ubiquitin-conjugating enzyme E2 A